jgi:hypothetical protein
MHLTRRTISLALCLIISMIVGTGGCSEPQDPLLPHKIRIVLIVPKTSPLRLNAQSAIQGAQLAMKKANDISIDDGNRDGLEP